VVEPFQEKILQEQISVYILHRTEMSKLMVWQDWDRYQLIMFNLIQNAVKYNQLKGDIVVILTCKPRKKSQLNIIFDKDNQNAYDSPQLQRQTLGDRRFSKFSLVKVEDLYDQD